MCVCVAQRKRNWGRPHGRENPGLHNNLSFFDKLPQLKRVNSRERLSYIGIYTHGGQKVYRGNLKVNSNAFIMKERRAVSCASEREREIKTNGSRGEKVINYPRALFFFYDEEKNKKEESLLF